MTPQTQPNKKQNSSKVNMTISAIVHGVVILGLLYFAAREGYLGKKIQTITVTKEPPKPKEPEKPKEEPKPEPPKVETPKIEQPKAEAPKAAPVVAPPVVAPANDSVQDFVFTDGAKAVNTESDPVQLYKGYLEYSLRAKWNRPDNMADDNFVAEVSVNVDKDGTLSHVAWQKGSGDARWDQTVKDVFKTVTQIDRRPPTNFPSVVTIRFDVQEETEPVLQ
jgi:hypothetical protein